MDVWESEMRCGGSKVGRSGCGISPTYVFVVSDRVYFGS